MSKEIRREISKLNNLIRSDRLDRTVLSAIQTQLDIRIFKEGRYADGRELGVYSLKYQEIRRKEKKHPIKSVVKVDLQFTGQMRKDFKLKVIAQNQYGSGFDNLENFNKSFYVEDLYRGKIFELSKEELNQLEELYAEAIERSLN